MAIILPSLFTNVIGQNASGECTIHVFCKGWAASVYVNDSLITGLNKDEALEYKLPAKGRSTLKIQFADMFSTTLAIDTKKQPHYYVIAYEMIYPVRAAKNKIVDAGEWKKESKNFADLVKINGMPAAQ